MQRGPSARVRTRLTKLTPRENEVLELILEGYNDLAIAGRLYLSVDTVKRHMYNLTKKLHVQSRLDLAVTVLKQRHAEELAALARLHAEDRRA